MLALGTRSLHAPRALPPEVGLADALSRAQHEASAVAGAFAAPPCEFHVLPAPAAARLVPADLRRRSGTWVLVTVRQARESGHRAHLRERCLTAAQRFMLSLACDGVESTWTDDAPSPADARASGVRMDGREPVGMIWCEAVA